MIAHDPDEHGQPALALGAAKRAPAQHQRRVDVSR